MNKIKGIECKRFSSKYGEFNNSFGQPLGVKSIVILTVTSSSGYSRSHELYGGIYIPEIYPKLISTISGIYIGREITLDFLQNPIKLPFVSNSGIFKSVTGAIESCIMQIYFSERGISLVDGLKTLLDSSIRRNKDLDIKYYGSGGSVAYSPNKCIEDLKKTIQKGLDGFKMRCGLKDINEDIERVKSVHDYISKIKSSRKPYLMIDLIQGTLNHKFSTLKLKQYLDKLSNFNILWIEEPLDPDEISLYEEFFYSNSKFNLCLGESFTCLNEFAAYKNIINFFQLDVTHLGGFPETIKVLNYMCKNNSSIRFSSHVWGSSLSGLLNLAICRASNSISWFEIPLLNFDINMHIIGKRELDYSNINNNEIDYYLDNINLDENIEFEFIENSGYKL